MEFAQASDDMVDIRPNIVVVVEVVRNTDLQLAAVECVGSRIDFDLLSPTVADVSGGSLASFGSSASSDNAEGFVGTSCAAE